MRHLAIALGLSATLACQSSGNKGSSTPELASAPGAESAQIAARIHGRAITVEEIDDQIKDELFLKATNKGEPGRVYEIRNNTLQARLNRQVVADAAKAENLSAAEFVKQELEALEPISSDEIAAFFGANAEQMSGTSLELATGSISTHLTALRVGTVISDLREKAGVVVLLEPARTEIDAIGPSKGPDDAAITLIEFTNFQCPKCQRFEPTAKRLLDKYPDQIRLVFRHYPFRTHPRSQPAGEAAACADAQGKFWVYHDRLFKNRVGGLSDNDLEHYGVELGLEMEAFRQCISERETKRVVDADAKAAKRLGLTSAPSFFLNGIRVTGARSLDKLSKLIDKELALQQSEAAAAPHH